MKFRYALVAALLLGLVGVLMRFLEIPVFTLPMIIGFSFFWIFSIVYVILALIKKRDRWVAGHVGILGFLLLGYMFKLMHWPGSGFLLVVCSNMLMMYSVMAALIMYVKKRGILLPVMLVSMAASWFYLTWSLMYWPGHNIMFVALSLPLILVVLGMILTGKGTPDRIPAAGWGLVSVFTLFVYLVPPHVKSYLFSIQRADSEWLNPLMAIRHAYHLNLDGQYEEAERYFEIGKQNLKNAQFIHLANDPKINSDIGYYEAKLEAREWNEFDW